MHALPPLQLLGPAGRPARPAHLARPAVEAPGVTRPPPPERDVVRSGPVASGGVADLFAPSIASCPRCRWPRLTADRPAELYNIGTHALGSLLVAAYFLARWHFIAAVAWPQVRDAACWSSGAASLTFPLTETAHLAALCGSLLAFLVSCVYHTTQRLPDGLREVASAVSVTVDRATVYVSAAAIIWADAVVAFAANTRDGVELAWSNTERLRLAGDRRPVGLDSFTLQLVAVTACALAYEIFGRALRETRATWRHAETRGGNRLPIMDHDERPCHIVRQQALLLLFGTATYLLLPLWNGEAFRGMGDAQRNVVYAYIVNIPLIVATFALQHAFQGHPELHAVWHVAATGVAVYSAGAREAALACARRGQRQYLLNATCATQYAQVAPAFGGEDDWFAGLCGVG